mmetsp:Transcript_2075/g.3114  ORF Transcript_2075/g.3114 Transcript_2075/m.3114 type:complete len:100 (+) Transcript_2075:85-384(+)
MSKYVKQGLYIAIAGAGTAAFYAELMKSITPISNAMPPTAKLFFRAAFLAFLSVSPQVEWIYSDTTGNDPRTRLIVFAVMLYFAFKSGRAKGLLKLKNQ